MMILGYTSETYLTVRYAETDQMGIVHHSRYYPWFEAARTDFIKKTGISYSGLEKMGIWLPLSETHAKYICGLRYEDEVVVCAQLISLRAASCEFGYGVYKLSERTLVTLGRTKHAFTDSTFKPYNLKKRHPDVWEMLSALLTQDSQFGF